MPADGDTLRVLMELRLIRAYTELTFEEDPWPTPPPTPPWPLPASSTPNGYTATPTPAAHTPPADTCSPKPATSSNGTNPPRAEEHRR
jgi:hypothetical protein